MSQVFSLTSLLLAIYSALPPAGASPSARSLPGAPPPSWVCGWNTCRLLPGNPPAVSSSSVYSCWDNIRYLEVFGASYAYTGPNIVDPQPPFQTSCNGPNYIDLMTYQWNQSLIETDNFAISGSPVDWTLLCGNGPLQTACGQNNDFVRQVDWYVGNFSTTKPAGWTPSNSLYLIAFGINDINYGYKNWSAASPLIFKQYQASFEQLYQLGARNFVFVNVPPIDRSPTAVDDGTTIAADWKADVIDFNGRLELMIEAVGNKHTDATIFLYDMNGVFSSVLDNTAYSDITAGYIDTTHNCTVYADSYLGIPIPSMTYKSPDCAYAVPQYFWFSGYHPTYPLHNLTANELAFGLQHLV